MNGRHAIFAGVLIGSAFALADRPATKPATVPALSGPLGKPVALFNGRNLDGWTGYQRPPKPGAAQPTTQTSITDAWSVRDGVVHTSGKPTGYIRTTATFANYVLTVEQRHVARGNGGILFGITGEDKIWPHCLEVQGATGEEGDIRNVTDFKMTMDPSRVEPRRLRRLGPDPEKPPGEWETIRIVVDRGRLVVFINDQLQNTATVDEPFAGRIGLQAEGGEMEFRKIELTPIE